MVGDGGECGADLLRFDDAKGVAIHEQEVIAGTRGERDFAKGNAPTGGEVDGLEILNYPAAGGELRVDLLAGALFGIQVRHGMTPDFLRPVGPRPPVDGPLVGSVGGGIAVKDSEHEAVEAG